MENKPNISQRAFWDVDFDKINYDINHKDVIRRVFQYGTMDDIYTIINYYGKEKTRLTLLNDKYLPEIAFNIASVIFDAKKDNFLCYTKNQ